MKKKFGAVLVAGVMACAMTVGLVFSSGCSATIPEFEMPEGGYDGSSVDLVFYTNMGQKRLDEANDAIKRFNVLFPNIHVTINNSSGSYDDLNDKIVTELGSNVQPNIAFCYSDHVARYNSANAVLTLDDFLPGGAYADMEVEHADGTTEKMGLTQAQKDDYVEAFFEEGRVFGDGKTYTLPFAKSTEVMYYNADFFEEHEKDGLYVPTTWAEMVEVSALIKEIDKDPTHYPFGYDSEANFFITLCEQYGSDYTSATGDHYLFDNETNRAFVQDLYEWRQAGYFTTAEIATTYTSNLFTEGKCYMSIGSTGGSTYQAGSFKMGVAPLPQVDPDNPKTILQGPSVCIFKKENPQEVIASWLLVKFLTTDVYFQATYSMNSGYMPVIKSVWDTEGYQDFLTDADSDNASVSVSARAALACKSLIDADAFYTSPAFLGSSVARAQVGTLLVAVLQNNKTIDKAFRDAIEECEYFG